MAERRVIFRSDRHISVTAPLTRPVEDARLLSRPSLVDEMVVRLREEILDGALAPGQVIRQTELCERFGVSRTPLRQALRIIESEGLAHTVGRTNTLSVVDLTVEELVEMYSFREVIDGVAARLAARRGVSADVVARLREMLASMRAQAADPRSDRYRLHAEFHAALLRASCNRHVIAQTSVIRLTSQVMARRVRRFAERAPEHMSEMFEHGARDHDQIVGAIEAGDEEGAERLARLHIRKTLTSDLLNF